MRDWSYLESACRAYDAHCLASGWPVPARGRTNVPEPPRRATGNGARDAEIRRRAAAGEFIPTLAREFGLSTARAYQIARAARSFSCRECRQPLDGHRRQYCPTCNTERKHARQRAWNMNRRARQRAREAAARAPFDERSAHGIRRTGRRSARASGTNGRTTAASGAARRTSRRIR